MASIRQDLTGRAQSDLFDLLPDSIVILIFNKFDNVKALVRCCVVSRRFHYLVTQVDEVVVRVDCVISDDEPSPISSSSSASSASSDNSRHPISSLFRFLFDGLFKPLQSLTQLVSPSASGRRLPPSHGLSSDTDYDSDHTSVAAHHSPGLVLKNFNEIKLLRMEFPSCELGIDEGSLLLWKANFGSTLDNCVILGASSVIHKSRLDSDDYVNLITDSDDGSIPESFYANGGLKLRVVWTVSSLIAAAARHYLLQPIIAEHKTLKSLVLTDADGQGVLTMNKEQLEELRLKPLLASKASKRTLIPALNMRLWYAPCLELMSGMVLRGATLVAIRPSEKPNEVVSSEGNWVSSAFEEPYGEAARMLAKRRTYCLEMNSF